MGWVKFTGDYAKLKTMGYKFQKLYARNYMSWNRGDLWIFKVGKDITHNEFNLYDFISFMRTNPVVREYESNARNSKIVSFLIEYDDKGNTKFLPYDEENRRRMSRSMDAWREWEEDSGEPAPIMMSSKAVPYELIEQLQELNDLGWYELVEGDLES